MLWIILLWFCAIEYYSSMHVLPAKLWWYSVCSSRKGDVKFHGQVVGDTCMTNIVLTNEKEIGVHVYIYIQNCCRSLRCQNMKSLRNIYGYIVTVQ